MIDRFTCDELSLIKPVAVTQQQFYLCDDDLL